MSSRLLLRAFVNERLTAAAEEIFQVFERTIAKYEEEASSSKQEIERLKGLLLEFVSKQKTGRFSMYIFFTCYCQIELESLILRGISPKKFLLPCMFIFCTC